MGFNLLMAGESMKVIEEHQERLHKLVRVEDGHIVLDGHYCISLDRIDTKEKILGWIMQLSDKNWVTAEMMGKMVDLACHFNDLGNPRIPL